MASDSKRPRKPDILPGRPRTAALQQKIGRWCKTHDISALYTTKVGIKCANPLVSSRTFLSMASESMEELDPSQLLLRFDGLKDDYSLLGTPVFESPHFQLMQAVMDGADYARLEQLEYTRRAAGGTLDFRLGRKITAVYLDELRSRFSAQLPLIETGRYEPVKVVETEGHYFIADGKHRAAVCAVLGKTVNCLGVEPLAHDSFFLWVYRKMQKTPEAFSKHISYFQALTKQR